MPLRRTILWLAEHKGLRRWVETSPVARRVSSRFVAGSTDWQMRWRHAGVCGRRESRSTLDYLGEGVKTLDEAAACRDNYLAMIDGARCERP